MLTKIDLKKKAGAVAMAKAATHGRNYELWMYRMALKAMVEALEMAGIKYSTIPEF